jgi:hypothetical protein
MPGPIPKPAGQRQRRNRTTTAASLEAPPVTRVDLPTLTSPDVCSAEVDRKSGCPLPSTAHDLEHFAKYVIEPHAFIAGEIAWQPMTLAWWTTIWASPMVAEWVDADVPGLIALAILWDSFYRTGNAKVHAEARMATREFGLSPLSRRQLQWEVKRLDVAAKPKPGTRPRRRSGPAVLGVLTGGKARGAHAS